MSASPTGIESDEELSICEFGMSSSRVVADGKAVSNSMLL
jgi:hypothetical protein